MLSSAGGIVDGLHSADWIMSLKGCAGHSKQVALVDAICTVPSTDVVVLAKTPLLRRTLAGLLVPDMDNSARMAFTHRPRVHHEFYNRGELSTDSEYHPSSR
jgi:hypothetical protein